LLHNIWFIYVNQTAISNSTSLYQLSCPEYKEGTVLFYVRYNIVVILKKPV